MQANSAELKDSIAALSARLAGAVESVSPAIVALDARPRVRTSGVIWRPGVVVSTNHTVRRDEEITVTLHDGREVKATLAGRDAGTDLAVLRLEEGADAGVAAGGPARFLDASALKVGHLVLAVGRAYPEHGVGASFGIVGLLGERWRTWRGCGGWRRSPAGGHHLHRLFRRRAHRHRRSNRAGAGRPDPARTRGAGDARRRALE